ncbi:MAG: hypothetical protein R3C52_04430 [Hyphomonadaceae bacterium]
MSRFSPMGSAVLVAVMALAACAPEGGDDAATVAGDAGEAQAPAAAAPAAADSDAAGIGDAYLGYAHARQACARCHAIAEYETESPDPEAPTFVSVVNQPETTADSLRTWLRSSHPTMPDFIIKPERIEDLVAYIMSLKTS